MFQIVLRVVKLTLECTRLANNGLRVLSKIPGLLDHIGGHAIEEVHFYSTVEEDNGPLGVTDYPKTWGETDGLGLRTIERPTLQHKLVAFSEESGVQINWGHKLESLEQHEDRVSVTFSNGAEETFSFVVGCDGLHSQTRNCLFGQSSTRYTGISMVRDINLSFAMI